MRQLTDMEAQALGYIVTFAVIGASGIVIMFLGVVVAPLIRKFSNGKAN